MLAEEDSDDEALVVGASVAARAAGAELLVAAEACKGAALSPRPTERLRRAGTSTVTSSAWV